jgi:hypothetical protein
MAQYRKKPVVIEAVQLKYSTASQENCIKFTNGIAKKVLMVV